MLSRHQINPTVSDWRGVKRVFSYLKGTKSVGWIYLGKSDIFEGYSDASIGDCKGSLTTSGYIVKLFGDAIAWKTRQQRYVSLSTCQAEYVSRSDCCQELISIHNTLKNVLSKELTPIILWCDSLLAVSNVKTSGGTKLRHMTDIKEHYVKECSTR